MDHRFVATAALFVALGAPTSAYAQDPAPEPTASTDAGTETDSAIPEPAATEPSSEADGWDAPQAEEPPRPRVAMSPVSAATEDTEAKKVDLEYKSRRSRAKGLMVGGWTTFSATYIAALTAGVVAYDVAGEDDERQRKWGRRMTIPIGGPIAASFVADSATGTLFTALTGAAQAAGLAMGIAGTAMYVKQKKNPPRLSFGVAPSRTGMHMGATWRF